MNSTRHTASGTRDYRVSLLSENPEGPSLFRVLLLVGGAVIGSFEGHLDACCFVGRSYVAGQHVLSGVLPK